MRKILYVMLTVFVLSTILSLNGWAAPPDESLVLYLPFDEGKGDEAKDMSIYDHEANLVNDPAWVDGKMGKALEFDGSNYVMVPITDELQLTEIFTVNFWVLKAGQQPAAWNYMVAGGTLKWAVILNADQKVYVYTADPAWSNALISDEILPDGWTHVSMIHNTDEIVEIYFNGELAGTGDQPAPVDTIDGSVMVGARHPGQEFFAGIIDEVALYNRALTIDEIERDMEAVGGAAVSNSGKLVSTWAKIKSK